MNFLLICLIFPKQPISLIEKWKYIFLHLLVPFKHQPNNITLSLRFINSSINNLNINSSNSWKCKPNYAIKSNHEQQKGDSWHRAHGILTPKGIRIKLHIILENQGKSHYLIYMIPIYRIIPPYLINVAFSSRALNNDKSLPCTTYIALP